MKTRSLVDYESDSDQDPPRGEGYKIPLEAAKAAVRESQRTSSKGTGKLVYTAVPYMSREEKRDLMARLVEEEDDRAGDILARHQNWSESLTGAAGSQDPVPPSGELPAAVKKKRLEVFREQLYNEQVQGGRFQPSEMSPTPSPAQKKCGHPSYAGLPMAQVTMHGVEFVTSRAWCTGHPGLRSWWRRM